MNKSNDKIELQLESIPSYRLAFDIVNFEFDKTNNYKEVQSQKTWEKYLTDVVSKFDKFNDNKELHPLSIYSI